MKSKANRINLITVLNVLVFAFLVAGASADSAHSQAQGSTASSLGGAGAAPMTSVGSTITYQGFLVLGGGPANGQYDFQFTLYDALSGGNQVGGPVLVSNQTVSNGFYRVQLDFGSSAFMGDARWLEIAERPAGGGNYTTLSPRQPLSAVPYAQSLMPGAVVKGTIASSPVISVTNTGIGGSGVWGSGSIGVFGSGAYGLEGISNAAGGIAVVGSANGSNSTGVKGSGAVTGVEGDTTNSSGYGVYGNNTGSGTGVGVYGNGYTGVFGRGSFFGLHGVTAGETAIAVAGESQGADGTGVLGSGFNGLYGTTTAATGLGVFGLNAATGGTGVLGSGTGTGSSGVRGDGYYGVSGNGSAFGVYGSSAAIGGAGVYGYNPSNIGVYGQGGYAVYGSGIGNGSTAIYGNSVGTGSWAGYFSGNVRILGGCCGSAALNTQIDDPQDPADKYLNQTAVESPDMLDIYRGHVNLDSAGEATVAMPSYFQALNRDFDYQLTAIGAPAPNLYIAQEIQNNQFKIAGGKPGMKVSWQVTGVRDDPYAKAHPLIPQQDKPSDERGYYLNPELYGQPASKSVDQLHSPTASSNPPTPPTQSTQASQPIQPGGK